MAIALAYSDYCTLLQEGVECPQGSYQAVDVTRTYPPQLGQGFMREMRLRAGLGLAIADYQSHDDITLYTPEREHSLEYTFTFPDGDSSLVGAVPYQFFGSGIAPEEHYQEYTHQRVAWLSVHIEPELFRAFVGHPEVGVPEVLQHLIGDPNQEYYVRAGQATPTMGVALRQILHCPYQGPTRHLFLESKVLELMALILEQEVEAQGAKLPLVALKPEDIDRLHWAKEVLHQSLDQPLSMAQLARAVGLNECTLKQGFRQLFQTTVFSYLRQCRMEQARLLLLEGRMNVREAAQAVGYSSQSRFATAFRKTFGVNPKAFSDQRW